jgi:hypothetical protein
LDKKQRQGVHFSEKDNGGRGLLPGDSEDPEETLEPFIGTGRWQNMGFRLAEVKGFLGKESGDIVALDKVSRSDIRHWIECMEDRDVSYEEIKGGKTAAPPAMMMVWTMPPLWTSEQKGPSEPHEHALKALEDAGYDGAVGLELDQEFLKPVRIGDRLSYKVKLAGVSPKAVETKMGKGFQVDLVFTMSNEKGEVVSKHNYSLLKYKQLKPAS